MLTILITFLVLAPTAAAPQQRPEYLGPGQCLNCHTHDAEKDWYSKKELLEVQRLFPDRGANAGHVNSLQQLETPKSDTFAKAIGLADKYDVKGACVRCHATVFGGDANAGVSCESCHGPGSLYLAPHQVKGAYDQSVAQFGMTKLVGNVQGWTQQCTNCHIMDDDRLIKAGHPSGDDWDLSKKFAPVSLHFKKTYSADAIAAIAKPEMEGIMRRRRPNAAPPPLVMPTPTAGVVPTGSSVTLAPPPVAPPPAAAPATVPTPTTTTPAAPKPKTASPPPAPKPSPAPAPVLPPLEPPGSPTSIEPPPPPPDASATTTAPATTAPASTPPATVATEQAAPESNLMTNPLVWAAIVAGLGAGLFIAMRRRKA